MKTNHQLEALKIKFDGQTHSIEANTLINSLIHFTNIVHETNRNLDPDKKVEVKIVANREGSFVVDFLLQTFDSVKTLLNPDVVSYASDLASTVETIYNIAKFLGGKKPKEISSSDANNVTITNENGDVNYFDLRGATIYTNNKSIRDAISQQFSTLENDESVTGFSLLDKNEEEVVKIERKEFYDLSNEYISESEKNERIKSIVCVLNIIAIDFELKKKWDFYHNGNKISAKIKAETFADAINKGERFAKGDSLEVEMDIKQEFDESVNTFVNKSYTVTKIINHFQRPSQGNLGLQ